MEPTKIKDDDGLIVANIRKDIVRYSQLHSWYRYLSYISVERRTTEELY